MSGSLYPASLPGLKAEVLRQYVWNTGYQKALANKASALSYMAYPDVHFELSYEILRDNLSPSDIKALVGLHNQMAGRGDTFLYTDPEFNTVSAQLIGTSTGSTSTRYQIVATYQNAGGPGSPEAIQNLNGTPTIFDNGTAISGTHYTIDALGGLTFSISPTTGHTITWSGSFYYRCRFDQDTIDWQKFMDRAWQASKVPFTSELV